MSITTFKFNFSHYVLELVNINTMLVATKSFRHHISPLISRKYFFPRVCSSNFIHTTHFFIPRFGAFRPRFPGNSNLVQHLQYSGILRSWLAFWSDWCLLPDECHASRNVRSYNCLDHSIYYAREVLVYSNTSKGMLKRCLCITLPLRICKGNVCV